MRRLEKKRSIGIDDDALAEALRQPFRAWLGASAPLAFRDEGEPWFEGVCFVNDAVRTSLDAYDVERIRRDFPILGERPYGKPLVYLDNAASAQKPKVVIDRLVACVRT